MRGVSQFDRHVGRAIRRLPAGLHGLMDFASYIGQPIYTIATLILTGGFGILSHSAPLVAASIIAGATFGFNSLLKVIFHRARPASEYVKNMVLESYSFPSGHAASGVVVFGLLALIAHANLSSPYNVVVAAIIAAFIVIIGLSRIYLQAHYPSDVLIGWLVGSVGIVVIIASVGDKL